MKGFNKRVLSLCMVLLIILSFCLTACSKDEEQPPVSSHTGYVSMDSGFSDATIVDEQSALAAMQDYRDALGISNAATELTVTDVQKVEGQTFYRMQQYYNGVKVYGQNAVLSVGEDNKANALTANTQKLPDQIDMEVSVTQAVAEENIGNYIWNVIKLENGNEYPVLQLTDCEKVLYEKEDGQYVYVYVVPVAFCELFVDAKTGEVVNHSDTVYEDSTVTCYNGDGSEEFEGYYVDADGLHYIYNAQRGVTIYSYQNTNSQAYNHQEHKPESKDAYFGNTADAQEVQLEYNKGVTLMNNFSDIYDFFYNRFGEVAYGQSVIYYNDGYTAGKNALGGYRFVNGQQAGFLSMGSVTGVEDLDVMAHEYTHMVTRCRIGWRGGNENLAVNEGYSDLFGEIAESYITGTEPDWVMTGDKIGLNRNVASPSSSGYPEKVSDPNYSPEDFGHAYSMIISHAGYLMWNGIDGNEAMKIDLDTLARMWYNSILLMHSDADFAQCANAVILASKTMKGLTQSQLDCVVKAFEQVGILSSSGSSTGIARGSVLTVRDTNLSSYGNYHLKIQNGNNVVVDTVITDAGGYALDLEPGTYQISVSDNDPTGSKDVYTQDVIIAEGAPETPVTIYTNFSGIAVVDFTMPEEMVITLGELNVIEPVIVPSDATGYSIKWTSSDPGVATVTPTGEAGIINALAKGSTTITAELTAAGQTITRTTNLRVASKSRDTVLVLDISGSMTGDPIREMKESAIQFCNDLLKDDYNNRVGIVFYDRSVQSIDLTNDLDYLISRIQNIDEGGTTNMEAGLAEADAMLLRDGRSGAIKNVVIMADGLPNTGISSSSGSMPNTGYYGFAADIQYANAVIDTAQNMMNRYNMYSLGFFHELYDEEKDFAVTLMKELTNQPDGYHQVDRAEDLQFAFADISEDINVGSKIVINIACPVDVVVCYGDEKLSSVADDYQDVASFGVLQLLGKDKDIKVLSLDGDKEYEVELFGTGEGTMDYTVNYYDEKEKLLDTRSFEAVPITQTTIITSTTDTSVEDMKLNIDEDGDGEIDFIWTALSMGKGKITFDGSSGSHVTVIIVVICIVIILLVGALIIVLATGNKTKGSDVAINEQIQMNIVFCSYCGKAHPSNQQCDCQAKGLREQRTEEVERTVGVIQVTNGSMNGFAVPIRDGETLYLGKDARVAHLVFTRDYIHVSRMHCAITYSAKTNSYYVTDASSNGTYFTNKARLQKGRRTSVKNGTILLLANEACTIWLR